MKLKLASFCSYCDGLSNGILILSYGEGGGGGRGVINHPVCIIICGNDHLSRIKALGITCAKGMLFVVVAEETVITTFCFHYTFPLSLLLLST